MSWSNLEPLAALQIKWRKYVSVDCFFIPKSVCFVKIFLWCIAQLYHNRSFSIAYLNSPCSDGSNEYNEAIFKFDFFERLLWDISQKSAFSWYFVMYSLSSISVLLLWVWNGYYSIFLSFSGRNLIFHSKPAGTYGPCIFLKAN